MGTDNNYGFADYFDPGRYLILICLDPSVTVIQISAVVKPSKTTILSLSWKRRLQFRSHSLQLQIFFHRQAWRSWQQESASLVLSSEQACSLVVSCVTLTKNLRDYSKFLSSDSTHWRSLSCIRIGRLPNSVDFPVHSRTLGSSSSCTASLPTRTDTLKVDSALSILDHRWRNHRLPTRTNRLTRKLKVKSLMNRCSHKKSNLYW